ncbi:MAG: hypothetical protein AABX79_01945 [Nanoarchaeota archaeon]
MEEKIFCPKCKSVNVKLDITASASLGAPQMWICNSCGYENYVFPKKQLIKKNINKK